MKPTDAEESSDGLLAGWIAGLSAPELDALARALDSGRVAPGISAAALRQAHLPETWLEPLGRLAIQGWTSALLAQAVRLGKSERTRAVSGGPRVVSTQPGVAETGFVDTAVVLRRLFLQAEREVLLAGFRVTDREMLKPLYRPESKRLDIRLFVDVHPEVSPTGKKCAPPPNLSMLPSLWWQGFLEEVWPEVMDPPRAWYSPSTLAPGKEGWRSMHIKTVVVDRREWFVTSANFTTRGQDRNFELGALIRDAKAAEAVIRHFEGLVRGGVFEAFPGG